MQSKTSSFLLLFLSWMFTKLMIPSQFKQNILKNFILSIYFQSNCIMLILQNNRTAKTTQLWFKIKQSVHFDNKWFSWGSSLKEKFSSPCNMFEDTGKNDAASAQIHWLIIHYLRMPLILQTDSNFSCATELLQHAFSSKYMQIFFLMQTFFEYQIFCPILHNQKWKKNGVINMQCMEDWTLFTQFSKIAKEKKNEQQNRVQYLSVVKW